MKSNASAARFTVIAVILAILLPASSAVSQSRYSEILKSPAGVNKLELLALMEEKGRLGGEIDKLVADPDPLIRMRCAEVLGRVDDPDWSVHYLTSLCADSDDEVVRAALYSLGLAGHREETAQKTIETIEKCLTGKGIEGKIVALEALGMTHLKAAAPILKNYMRNFNASVRKQAVLAMAVLDDSSAAPEVAVSLHDPDTKVSEAAVYTIGRLGYEKAAHTIVQLLASPEPSIRYRAVEALGRLEYKKAAETVAMLLEDRDRTIRIKAAETLAKFGDKKSSEILETVLDSDDSYMRAAALQGIAAAREKGAFEKVVPLLSDESIMVRRAAIGAAALTGKKNARDRLLEIFRSGGPYDRMTAIEYLGEIGEKADLALLARTVRNETNHFIREGAAAGLARWKDGDQLLEAVGPDGIKPLDALIEAAKGGDWVVAAMAVDAIGATVPASAVTGLIEIFRARDTREDRDVRLSIIAALGPLAEHDDLAPEQRTGIEGLLKLAMTDPDPRVPRAAAAAATGFGLSLEPDPALANDWDRGALPWGEPSLPLGKRKIQIVTNRGRIDVELFGDDAPNIVRSVIFLAKDGFYNGLTFHRVVPDFVIQGGCPRGDGWGDAGYYLRSLFNGHRYERGTVGVAHAGKDTPGSQFFITHTPQHHLNGRYTIIGKVTGGMDVVDRIEIGDTFVVKVME